MLKVILKKGKEEAVQRGHAWIFSGAIDRTEGSPGDGDTVNVLSHNGKFLAVGHYQNGSIAVRVLSTKPAEITADFWYEKIEKAWNYRVKAGITAKEDTNCWRLVFGEADGVPGLIIDWYNGHAVFQAHTPGMYRQRNDICAALKTKFGEQLQTIYDRSKEYLPAHYKDKADPFLYGRTEECTVSENGNKFIVNWAEGQKTGFFLDQRDNRRLLGEYSKGKKVLNNFCYTGGFSVYAARAGAAMVHSVDSSKKAISLAEKNVELNGLSNHEAFCEDTFDFMKRSAMDYDIVVLDPPAFARHREARHKAVIGYKNLNALALKKMKPESVLFTFSCTQVVEKQLFFNTVTAAAIEAGREIRILHYLNQPGDHPINPLHPESEYLKGLVVFVF